MKTFRIYTHAEKDPWLVKDGWSWPAIFFSFLWALANGLFGYALILFCLVMGSHVLLTMVVTGAEELLGVSIFLNLVVFIWVGTCANDWNANRLLKRGYTYVAKIEAANLMKANRQYAATAEETSVGSSEESPVESLKDNPENAV